MPSGTPIDAVWKRRRNLDRRGRLKPMTASEMVDTAIQLYRTHALTLIRATAPSALLTYAGLVQIFAFVGPSVFSTRNPTNPQLQVAEMAITVAVAALIAVPLCLLGLNYPLGFVASFIGQALRGDVPDEKLARKEAESGFWERLLTIGPAMLLTFGPVLMSVVLMGASSTLEKLMGSESWVVYASTILAVGGLFVSVFSVPVGLALVSMTVPAQVWEKAKPWAAFQRCRQLSKNYPRHGSAGNALLNMGVVGLFAFVALDGTLALMTLVVTESPYLEQFFARTFAGTVMKGAVQALPAYLALLFVLPLMATCVTVLYFERRVRLEAYDIDVMTADAQGGWVADR